jgi:hypothetical protein
MNAFRPPENLVSVHHDSGLRVVFVSSFSFRFGSVPAVKRNGSLILLHMVSKVSFVRLGYFSQTRDRGTDGSVCRLK